MSQIITTSRSKDGSMELSFPVPWGIIAAKAWGDPCLYPVIVVHGVQDNAGSFDRIIPLLPSNFYYVCIDLPGHGKSSRLPKGMYLDFMLYIMAIRRVILQLQWTEYYYIGHSLGGQLGTYYTALYSDEVKKLVILDTLTQLNVSLDGFFKYYQERIKQLLEIENKMLNKEPPQYTYEEALNRSINHRPSPITREAAEALLPRSLKEGKNNTYYFSTDQRLKFGVRVAITNEQHLYILSKIVCPVIIVITNKYLQYVEVNKDNVYSLTLDFFQKKNNVEIIKIDGDHDVHNIEPELVAPHVNRFLLHNKSLL